MYTLNTAVRVARSDYMPSEAGSTLSLPLIRAAARLLDQGQVLWTERNGKNIHSERERCPEYWAVKMIFSIPLWPWDLPNSWLIQKGGKGKIPRSPRLIDETIGEINDAIKCRWSLMEIQPCTFTFFFSINICYVLCLGKLKLKAFSASLVVSWFGNVSFSSTLPYCYEIPWAF